MKAPAPIKLAMLLTDAREAWREYAKPEPYFGTAPEALLQGLSALHEVEVHLICCMQRPMACPEKIAPNIWYHGLRVPKIGWLRTGYLGCIRATRRKLRELRPDIVHGQGTEREAALCAALSGFPSVVTIHGNMAALAKFFRSRIGSFNWLAARVENFALPRTEGVFCNSAYTEELVRPRTPRTWRVPNAIRQEFVTDPPVRTATERGVVLNVGVISPRKRQVELLACARRLHEAGANLEWHFCGTADGAEPYAARFLEEMKAATAAGYARYLGTRTSAEILECFDSATGLVHFPSEEAFGLVVAEALARNLKLFASNLGGIAEIAAGVDRAELIDCEDWAGLEAALRAWAAEGFPTPADAASAMRARYSPVAVARQHLAIYREVLSAKSA